VDFNFDASAADMIADRNDPFPLPDNTLELVRAIHLIEHVIDVMKTMAEMHRMCRPEGTIYLVTPH